MVDFPQHIFREYDIRGLAGSDITQDFAYQLGKAYATLLPIGETRPVTLAHDARLSSPELHQAVRDGLTSMGIHVMDIGLAHSPLAYFTVFHYQTAGCIIITASHNPAEYNGFKFMRGKESLHGQEIQELKVAMQQEIAERDQQGIATPSSIQSEYEQFIAHDCPLSRPLKVVIDAGNGPTGLFAAPLYRRMGCHVTELYCQPNGHFPNHHPDPSVFENLQDLIATVRDIKADLGIAFDGDGDRIGIVDEKGDVIWNDLLLLILAKDLLRMHPQSTIISEVKSSNRLYEGIRVAGGVPIMWRTGHSPIKAKMKETGALLAGEMSGHIFYADRYQGFDDAVYAGARLMQVIADSHQPLSAQLQGIPHCEVTPEIRIACADERKFQLVAHAQQHFSKLGYPIIDVDGIRIEFPDGWGLLRASNTQAALTLRFEAPTQKRLKEMQKLIIGWLQKHNPANQPTDD